MIKKSMIKNVISMARGKLVIDECVDFLSEELKKLNIKILKASPGSSDDYIKEHFLPDRIIVTNNTKDFINDASSFEYGIISTENIKFKDPKKLAKLISDEIIKNKLWSKKPGFVLYLKEPGPSLFEELKD